MSRPAPGSEQSGAVVWRSWEIDLRLAAAAAARA